MKRSAVSPLHLLVLISALACFSAQTKAAAFKPDKLAVIDETITQAIQEKKLPGGVLWIEHNGNIHQKTYGRRALLPSAEPMTEDTIFDAASLTKVVATTPAIMLLVERGSIDLEAPVARYIPEFADHGKEAVTVRHLLTHTSGLRSGIGATPPWSGYNGAIERASAEKLQSTPGTMFVYSDINFFVLGEVAQRAGGQKLNEFVASEIYRPLKMNDTGFLPPADKLGRIAPTEPGAEGEMLRGVVHDPTARKMGGVAGHAGLFTTAADLARYCRMLLNGGSLDGVRVFKPETVQRMTAVQTPDEVAARRGLGWDIDSRFSGPRGKLFPLGSYGHTGWTGTSVWLDPFSKTFVMFLSNRNHPDGKGNVVPLRATLGTLAAEAIEAFDFTRAPAGALPRRQQPEEPKFVLNGIDVLVREHFIRLRGMKIGLVTNHTGQDRDRRSTIDLLYNAPGVELKALFAPEHGIRGTADTTVSDTVDEKTGVPIYSLYGGSPRRQPEQSPEEHTAAVMETRKPKLEIIRDLDALVFDIQDIGARFYTYSATMGMAIKAAAEAGKRIYVLDRVNPIAGAKFEGPVQTRFRSFIGFHTIPIRHGMTLGELARMFNEEIGFNADLVVVGCENWTRDMWYDQTGLPWSNPSPSMKSLNAATLYTGACLLEATTVSMGRGTDKPFEQVGAPYIDDTRFAWEMNRAGLPGVQFVPVRFTPVAEYYPGPVRLLKHHDKDCGGVYMVITDREKCNVVDIGIVMAQVLYRLYPDDFNIDRMSTLLGHEVTLQAIKDGKTLAQIKEIWAKDLADFETRRRKFLLYR